MPVHEWINARGERVRIFATDVPFKFRVEIDGEPYIVRERGQDGA